MVAVPSTSTSAATGPQSHIVSVQLRKTIQSIKEVVGNFSDSDILMALEESHMDPDETTQKLLNQDPFCEVKRKREKKKESTGYRAPMGSSKHSENSGERIRLRTFSDHNPQQGGFTHISTPRNAGINRQFRVVKDNRVNHNTNRELNPASQVSTLSNEQGIATGKSSGNSSNAKPAGVRNSSQIKNGHNDSLLRHTRDTTADASSRSMTSDEKRSMGPDGVSRVQAVKPTNSQHKSAMLPPSNSATGVYLSPTDPIHVPSPDSRTSAAVGAIKRDVGVVGGRRHSSDNPMKDSSLSSNSFSNSVLGGEPSLTESFQHAPAASKSDHVRQMSATEPVVPGIPVSRPYFTNHCNSRPHQQTTGNKKASLHHKEWKPKTNQKSTAGTPKESGMPAGDTSNVLDSNAADLQDNFAQVNIHENQNVIIAQHIRVSETDRCRLTFGSFGVEFDCSGNVASGFQSVEVTEDSNGESAASLSVSAPESTSDNPASGDKQVELLDDQVRNSGSDSSPSGAASEQPEKSSSLPDMDNYADIGLVQDSTLSFVPTESQQQQEPPELPNFSAYDPQAGYDVSYFRHPIDDTVQGQGLPIPQEALTSHTANNLPTSAIPLVQQQQHMPSAQMYPQVHVSHFANFMPYRQIISPVYVPQMAMHGYSSNQAYPHPSNSNSYLLMPGANSHLGANGVKYGIQQLKPIPANSPTGFGSFSSPIGYAVNAPGVVGSATGLDDSSRMKYKDGNLYAPNPQADPSEMWIQNPREIPSLQSGSYYNMPGQTPHAAYMPSHTGHASFNAAASQSSHMQFPGLYAPPPPQLPAMTAPHHLAPVMGGNVGVGVAPSVPGAQVGAYQQPQLSHVNWTTNFLK